MKGLSARQRSRYARHLALSEIREEGQLVLRNSRVLIVGLGGLGSPAALYLVAAGVGTLGVMDADAVELNNLQRQILHGTSTLGLAKTQSAARRLKDLNPEVAIQTYPERFAAANALRVLPDYDFVIDATDNLASKFLIADACHLAHRPYSHAGILEFQGQIMTVIPGETACYRCLFAAPPPVGSGEEAPAGPVGPVPGVVGALQAVEAIKFLLRLGSLLTNRLLVWDALVMRFRETAVTRDPHCALCGDSPTIVNLQ
jgi:molybdopterin-synthase adenylyltransferase